MSGGAGRRGLRLAGPHRLRCARSGAVARRDNTRRGLEVVGALGCDAEGRCAARGEREGHDAYSRRCGRRHRRRPKAYVADGPGGLSVIDVSDPAHPALTARRSVSGEAQALVVFGSNAYVAGGAGGFQVVPL